MNVIRRAKAVVAAEIANTAQAREHAQQASTHGKSKLVDGELHWFGEFYDPKETKAIKMANGDKQPMTGAELKLFARTPYERGVLDFEYEGTMRQRANPDVPAKRPNTVEAGAADGEAGEAVPEGDPRYWTREGTGVLRYPHGETYEGQWKLNKRQGEGAFVDPKGYRFRGNWIDDTGKGKGCEVFRSKASLDGTYDNCLPQGPGVLIFTQASTQYRYEGDFVQGKRHGKGTIFYSNGDTYVGLWENGQRHGRGVTTTYNDLGREIQYETEWNRNVLVSGPTVIEKGRRTARPKPVMKVNIQTLVPADLTKWKVKDEATELSLEHFLRIKLGFEKLDKNGTGSLSTEELTEIWGNDSKGMLSKLDTDGNGTVELDEIFQAWYPNVPSHNVSRFLQLDINPKTLLRIRGFLAGVKDESESGYYQMVGIKNPDEIVDKPITQKIMDTWGWKIGGERFTLANFEAAKVLCDPPHFMEIMEIWYPNIPRSTLARTEASDIPDIEKIKTDFLKLSGGSFEVSVEKFSEAQEAYCEKNYGHDEEEGDGENNNHNHNSGGAAASPSKSTTNHPDEASPPASPGSPHGPPPTQEEVILELASPGFFKGQPFWMLGNSIKLSVALLKDIDKFDRRVEGIISLQQILRYCYPNVKCRRTQDQLSGRRKGGACNCKICMLS